MLYTVKSERAGNTHTDTPERETILVRLNFVRKEMFYTKERPGKTHTYGTHTNEKPCIISVNFVRNVLHGRTT